MAHPQSESLPTPKKIENPPNRDDDRGFIDPHVARGDPKKGDDSPREPEDRRITKK